MTYPLCLSRILNWLRLSHSVHVYSPSLRAQFSATALRSPLLRIFSGTGPRGKPLAVFRTRATLLLDTIIHTEQMPRLQRSEGGVGVLVLFLPNRGISGCFLTQCIIYPVSWTLRQIAWGESCAEVPARLPCDQYIKIHANEFVTRVAIASAVV